MNNHQKLMEFILNAERGNAVKFLDDYAEEHSYREALSELLDPVLEELGDMWMEGKVSLAQGYVSSKIAEDILNKILELEDGNASEKKGPVVICNIEDDYHALGRSMVGTFLKAAGWEVIDLGNDVPADEMIDKCISSGARVVGVSAMMFTTAQNIKKVRDLIDERGLTNKIKLAVGGAVFKLRPGLIHEVGGDGTASSAIDAPKLFEKLWNEAVGEE